MLCYEFIDPTIYLQASSADLAAMMHSSLVPSNTSSGRHAALAAALQQPVGSNNPSSTGASNPQQFAAALASFQHLQNRQQMMHQHPGISGVSHAASSPQLLQPG